ncbi:unnamed protein product, partial [Effrenium voratum]
VISAQPRLQANRHSLHARHEMRAVEPGAVLEVNVKRIDGSSSSMEVRPEMTGLQFKELIAQKLGISTDQRLICRGRPIKDDDLVGAHVTESGQIVHMVQRPPTTSASSTAAPHAPVQVHFMPPEFRGGPGPGMRPFMPHAMPGAPTVIGPMMPPMPAPGGFYHPPQMSGMPPFPHMQVFLQQGFNPPPPPAVRVEAREAALAPDRSPDRRELPWRDLRRLHCHLSTALGRSNQFRPQLPPNLPNATPEAELSAFLASLHAATSQLGVAVSDMQSAVGEGQRPQRLQFTMVLASAGRVFRSLSSALMNPPEQAEARDRDVQPLLASTWHAVPQVGRPEHLARPYLSALLRDLRQFLQQQDPEVLRQHPNLQMARGPP